MKNKKSCNIPLYKALSETAYCVRKEELVAAAKVMSVAFSDDPSIRYLLGGKSESYNDWKYFLCVLKAIYGKCLILSTDNHIQNILILFPPQLKSVPTMPFLLNGGIALCRSFGINLFLRSLNYESNCRTVKKRCITSDTWYCMCFAVSPQTQGQGVGSQLIRPALNVLKDRNIPLYLETHKTVNVDIYKHLGFETVETTTIPGTKIVQYSMMKFQ